MASCGPNANKHDQANVLISACIMEGLDNGARIVGALKRLGFRPRHVSIVLKEGTGGSASSSHWRRDARGRYSLHEEGDPLR